MQVQNCPNSNSGAVESAVLEQIEDYFSQSLEVELLLRLCPDEEDTIHQIVNLLVDTCATNRKLLRVAGDDKPAEVVRSRFMKLNADHIRFVLKCLAESTAPVRNMKQYLLAALYNAPTTMQLYYQNQTNHDLSNRGCWPMPKSNANLALKGLDEMFSTEESRQEQKREQVQQIPIEELFPFKEHPFKMLDDEAMQRTVESVAQ